MSVSVRTRSGRERAKSSAIPPPYDQAAMSAGPVTPASSSAAAEAPVSARNV